ncbi:hypothetical protein V8E51_008165 [Hyaloscypha variabilis]|uniref:Uncharacterized protein n=1 Tax=Hyaloscypha variabilis (strain UAMH 11265 / GT02V1 / F) TaxID=1149755 RepID=A0A2J6S0L6_HYAVF|nr:hypothetical protein L207DRAFT_278801 [Hyaloscypha variabilis F]
MTEPDNFEEDLFADLYADEEPPKPSAPEAESIVEPAAEAETNGEGSNEHPEHNGGGDEQMYNGEEDVDDDDIDFNLGGNGNNYDAPATHESHGPGIKEDG